MTNTTDTGRKRKAPSKTASGKAVRRTSGPKKSGSGTTGRAATQALHMHTAHASIPVPYVTKGDLSANVRAAESALPEVKLPPPERLAFYGGLGALAVLGAVEWPVAAAIGAATVVARRNKRGQV